MSNVRILIGDVCDRLREIDSDSVDCVVTSPPYWGLRDYGVEGQIGLEPTLGEHISVMISVFDEVRRVMKPTASLWLNYGDCYATTPNGRSAAATKAAGTDDRTFRDKPFSTIGGALKPKDLCMVPNRLAIALQENGWWVRSEIVWGKPNAMPDSSGRYRPATAHEKIFLLSKTGKMHYDAEAVRCFSQNDPSEFKSPDNWNTAPGSHGSFHPKGREKGQRPDKQRGHSRRHAGFNDRWDHMTKEEQSQNGRLLRNYEPDPFQVWHLATAAFRDAHFATFPTDLAALCIAAGCPKGGVVLDPFGGAGTTGLVADRMGRDAILIELNPEYADLARNRISDDAGAFADVVVDRTAA